MTEGKKKEEGECKFLYHTNIKLKKVEEKGDMPVVRGGT